MRQFEITDNEQFMELDDLVQKPDAQFWYLRLAYSSKKNPQALLLAVSNRLL